MANELKFGDKVVFLSGEPLTLPIASSDPGTAVNGDMYYNSITNQLRVYQNGAWATMPTNISIDSGVAGRISLYPSSGTELSDTYVQNAQNINLSVAAQPTRSTPISYVIPNPGDAISSANFVLTEGAQIINGDKTLSGTIKLTSTAAGLPLQTSGTSDIIAALVSLSSQVTNVLPIANGGTNSSTTLNNNRVMVSSSGTIIELAAIAANFALISNVGGLPTASTTTATELGYVSGVTSSIQTQLNTKLSNALTQNHILVGNALNVATDVPMSGEASIVASGAITLSNAAVIGKVLMGYLSGAGTVTSIDSILSAIEKLDGNDGLRVLKAGDTMTGNLAMSGNKVTGLGAGTVAGDAVRYEQTVLITGVNAFTANQSMGGNKLTNLANGTASGDAVNYGQLTSLSLGLIWQGPINDPDLVDDSLSTPPGSPVYSLTYIISSSPTGAWTGLAGHAVWWDGAEWIDISTGNTAASGQGTAVQVGDRFLIASSSAGGPAHVGGTFAGGSFDGQIATVTGNTPGSFTYSFAVPLNNWATTDLTAGSQHYNSSFTYTSSAPYIFTVTAANATAGATYTNNGQTFTVSSTITGGTLLLASGTGFPSASGTLTKSSGTGDATITFSSFTGSNWIDFAGPGKSIAGAALAYTGNTLNVLYDNITIDLSSNKLEVKAGGISNTQVNAAAGIVYSKLNLSASIVNADIAAAAAIARTKLASGTAFAWVTNNVSGVMQDTSVTASRAVATDANGLPVASATTSTELGFVSGVTSSIQTQLNGKANTALSNLASVAINTSLLPGTDNSIDLGSASFRWSNVHALNHLLYGSSSGALTQQAAATTTSYIIKWPATQGAAGTFPQNDGSGNLSWAFAGVNSPTWTKYTKTFSDFSNASTSNSIILFTLGAKAMLHQVVIKHSIAFSGGSISAYTISVGDAGNNARFAVPFNVFQATSDTARSITQADDLESFASGTNITATATSTGGNLNTAAAGSVDIWVLTSTLT